MRTYRISLLSPSPISSFISHIREYNGKLNPLCLSASGVQHKSAANRKVRRALFVPFPIFVTLSID